MLARRADRIQALADELGVMLVAPFTSEQREEQRQMVEVGLARMIGARLACDVHRIDAAEPYPADYEETVQRNVRKQDADGRPAAARSEALA
jgi:hypothetical protein